jgi:hypothetical protein
MHRACGEFALRAEYKADAPRRLWRAAAGFIAIGICAGLAACADDGNYPSLAKIVDVGTVLTPQERQKAMEDLQKQNQAHGADAVKTASGE